MRNTGRMDKRRLDWLEEQVVSVIHLDNGYGLIIDVRGNSVREAIDRAMLEAEQRRDPR